MFGDIHGTALLVVDIFRWVSIVWLVVAMGWLVQIAVITRSISVTLLAAGLSLSLFVDLGDQYSRIGYPEVSYRFPVIYAELFLITLGMYFYVRDHSTIDFIPPFYFFIRYRDKKVKKSKKKVPG